MVLGWLAFIVAVAALFAAFWAMKDRGDDGGSGSSGAGAGAAPAASAAVGMSEFKFSPDMVMLPTGGGILTVTNTGSAAHNLELQPSGRTTGDIQPGATKELDVTGLSDGTYSMICQIAGHAASGMTGELMIGGSAAGTDGSTSAGATETTMSWQDMDAMMTAVAKQFPAETQGHGGETLEPTVLADGTKEFDLTAEIVQWEVAPGKFVEAWTYNGVVPAPAIHVQTGDKVKIVLQNDLPESTVIHFHGVQVPNSMDGVDPYTQDAVQPGQSFTYEFTAKGPAVGIYHSHHNAQVQVPNGLFGAFLIDEMPVPQKLVDQGYGTVDQHVDMVLNDAGTIGLSLNGKSFPATEAYKMKVGEVMEVNYFNEGLMAHPMHLHQPMGWIIAKDGVPLDEPLPGDTFNVAPGERYTVLYKATEPGVWAWHCHILNHAEGSEGMFGMVTALIVEA
jgi:FtsP/CotA-like multicopper oxidase with cupredoxin domain